MSNAIFEMNLEALEMLSETDKSLLNCLKMALERIEKLESEVREIKYSLVLGEFHDEIEPPVMVDISKFIDMELHKKSTEL